MRILLNNKTSLKVVEGFINKETSMRRIVHIGIGQDCNIEFKKGDIFLGCEPLISEMKQHNIWEASSIPDFVESYIFEGCIAPKASTPRTKFSFSPNELTTGFVLDGSGKRKRGSNIIEVDSLTLDEWLEGHKDQGFTESIDFFYSPIWDWNIMDILSEFSWCVKPRVILLSFSDHRATPLFKSLGYTVFKSRGPFLAITETV